MQHVYYYYFYSIEAHRRRRRRRRCDQNILIKVGEKRQDEDADSNDDLLFLDRF